MVSSNEICRFSIAAIVGMAFSAAGCAGTEVHQQGSSTAVITQSGAKGSSSTQVTKTPDGQKIVTKSGNSTDVTIQSSKSGSASSGKSTTTVDKDRFTRSTRDCIDCPAPRSSSARNQTLDDSSVEAFRKGIRDRMRPLTP
ncbi:hypothetical protein [Thiobaca trueperi]|uniref:Uncharacterized protein n=1 Tax=Thiobaca trueperi TaxID=127458 RepID=A0A4R3MXD4_9GAMM|nr:hypothetical protein [Thiobaca trueperi]TCT20206.1 hypothetical protein EDC35_106133 [Thiobaca trueperi]